MMNQWERNKIGRVSEKAFYRFFTEKQNVDINLLGFSNIPDTIKVYSVFDEFLGYSNKTQLCDLLGVKSTYIQEILKGRRTYCKFYKLKKTV